MFDSAKSILSKYIDTDKVTRFNFYSIEMERGENPEEIFYLCSIGDKHFVIFETDYILNTLDDIEQEATEIFKEYNLLPICWITKRKSSTLSHSQTVSIGTGNADKLRDSLISEPTTPLSGYAVRYAVIEFSKNTASLSTT